MALETKPKITQMVTDQILTGRSRVLGTIRPFGSAQGALSLSNGRNPQSLPSEASAKEGAIRNRTA
jgi:hypothetical protein